jgi:hypothetical protein
MQLSKAQLTWCGQLLSPFTGAAKGLYLASCTPLRSSNLLLLPPGSERGVVDAACGTLTPITMTAAISVDGPVAWEGGADAIDFVEDFTCQPDCVRRYQFDEGNSFLIIGPYHIGIFSGSLNFSISFTSADF